MSYFSYYEEGGVTYRCAVCGAKKSLTGKSAVAIAREFGELGWGNHPVNDGAEVKYLTLCSEHNSTEQVQRIGLMVQAEDEGVLYGATNNPARP